VTSVNGALVTREVFNLNNEAMKAGQDVSEYRFGKVSVWMAPNGLLVPVGVGRKRPYLHLLVATVALGSVAWIPYRFSLRTLLITTTLVAVGLGLVVWWR